MANHYSVLGVSPDATLQQIKAAYTKLVLRAHPDKGGSQSVFVQIQAAWEVLRDPATRAKYDQECQNAQKPKHHGRDHTDSGRARYSRDYSQFYGSSYYEDSMPGDHYSYTGSGYRTGPNSNSWNGYRDSTAGSAYSSYYGSFAGDANYSDTKPRASSTPEPEDTSHHYRRDARENHRDSYSQTRRRDSTASPPPRRSRSSSPPPTMPSELDLKTVKALAEQASRNLIRYKELIDMLRSSTKSHPLSKDIQIKLEHVHLFLQNRELKLNHRVMEIKVYKISQQTKSLPENMEPFFASLWETIVKEDKETVSDVSMSVSRVSGDTSQWLRRRNVLEARGLEVTDDDKVTQDLIASTEALERLLTKVLLSAPGVAPQRSY
ncbi:hypothetical protein AYL99_06135 [Fonsecaea erecta]|uniref:J domain-containing protein n=1 Tax=Fonsecaea erecta TaxID=1367422 RepID=A0A178ZGD3_9EURO|nr:hypothetical protein AYL99_06135 [Fonsecaea erecta]OAP58838.1 hypothetical protein AYL99_06135 [Fonsecaea erecta]